MVPIFLLRSEGNSSLWREDDYGWSFLLAQKHHLVLSTSFLPQPSLALLAAWCHHLNDIFKRCWLYVFSTKGLKKNHQDCRDLVRGLFAGSKRNFFKLFKLHECLTDKSVYNKLNSDFSNRRKFVIPWQLDSHIRQRESCTHSFFFFLCIEL